MKNIPLSHRKSTLILVGSVAAILAAPSARAALSTWAASPVSANWNNASNWGGTLPATGGTLAFGSSSQTTLNNDLTTSAFVINNITFNAGAPAYTISGNAFTFGTTTTAFVLNNNSAATQTIKDDIIVANGVQRIGFLASGGGDIVLAGNITSAGSNSEFRVAGAASLVLTGTASLGVINVNTVSTVKVDGGTVSTTIWGNNQSGGTIQVTNNGTLNITNVQNVNHYLIQDSGTVTLGTGSGDLISQLFYTATGGTASILGTIYNGLNLAASGTAHLTYTPVQALTYGASASGTLSLSGNAAVTFTNGLDLANNTGTGTINLNGGTLTLAKLIIPYRSIKLTDNQRAGKREGWEDPN